MTASLILRTATRYLLPLLLMFSVFLLFEGHHEPGGGFVGGLMAAAPLALCALAYGVPTTEKILPFRAHQLIGTGLILAGLSGTFSLLLGRPFLTSLWGAIHWPGGGKTDLGTPLLFDFGVYLTVIGVVLMIVLNLAEE